MENNKNSEKPETVSTDTLWQKSQVFTSHGNGVVGNPYPSKIQLQDKSAVVQSSGNIGLKGIIAGNNYLKLS